MWLQIIFFKIIQGTILFVKSVEQNHNGLCSTTNWVRLFFFCFLKWLSLLETSQKLKKKHKIPNLFNRIFQCLGTFSEIEKKKRYMSLVSCRRQMICFLGYRLRKVTVKTIIEYPSIAVP